MLEVEGEATIGWKADEVLLDGRRRNDPDDVAEDRGATATPPLRGPWNPVKSQIGKLASCSIF